MLGPVRPNRACWASVLLVKAFADQINSPFSGTESCYSALCVVFSVGLCAHSVVKKSRELSQEWRMLHNEELCDLYVLFSVVLVRSGC
jgi:hypothetical protein